MHVAVFVAMQLIVHILGRAAATGAHFAASFFGDLGPESAFLVVAAATAPGSFAAGLALARGFCGGDGRQRISFVVGST